MLHLFTCCFDGLEKEASAEGRVQAFLRVAMTCPDAAPKLVRTKPRRLFCRLFNALFLLDSFRL